MLHVRTGMAAILSMVALASAADGGVSDGRFAGTGTLGPGPQGCPWFVPDGATLGLFIENTGGFVAGTRVYVTGSLVEQSPVCLPPGGPTIEDNTIAELFEDCVVLTVGPQGCLHAVTPGDGAFFVTGTSGFELLEHSGVTAVIVPESNVCFPVTGPALDVLDLDPCLEGDASGDGSIGFADLSIILERWGACPVEGSCHTDLDGDGSTGFLDLSRVLELWGSTL